MTTYRVRVSEMAAEEVRVEADYVGVSSGTIQLHKAGGEGISQGETVAVFPLDALIYVVDESAERTRDEAPAE